MSVCVCMDGWMDGWLAGWMDGWMDGWMNGWLAGWMDGWMGMDACMHVCIVPCGGGARDPESGLIYIYIYICVCVCGKPCFFTNPNHRVKFISFHIHILQGQTSKQSLSFFPHTPPPTMWCLAVILVGLQHAVAVFIFMYISCHVYIYILSDILKYSLLYRYSMK